MLASAQNMITSLQIYLLAIIAFPEMLQSLEINAGLKADEKLFD